MHLPFFFSQIVILSFFYIHPAVFCMPLLLKFHPPSARRPLFFDSRAPATLGWAHTRASRPQIFGFSFSTTGVDWPAENGVAMPLLPRNASGTCSSLWTSRARTPLSLVDEGDGTYTMFYTGFGGAGSQSAAVSFVSLAFESVPLQPPQPPPPPPTPVSSGSFIPWVRECGVSVAVDVPISGNSSAPVLGTNITTEAECRALCEAHDNCTMYVGTYGDGDRCTLGEWCWICFGRTDSVWRPVSIPGIVSARRIRVALPPPPPQHQCLKTSDDDASVGPYWRQRSVDFKFNNRQPAWSSALRTSCSFRALSGNEGNRNYAR